jgi:hypothetical protein
MQEITIDKDGVKRYRWNNQLHREDGPAVELANGNKEWYLQDKKYTEEDYWRILKLKALW